MKFHSDCGKLTRIENNNWQLYSAVKGTTERRREYLAIASINKKKSDLALDLDITKEKCNKHLFTIHKEDIWSII